MQDSLPQASSASPQSAVKAVIFDVYHTLLAVQPGPPPTEAEARWQALWPSAGLGPAPVSHTEFDAACRRAIADDHAPRKAAGVQFPEVDWLSIACRAAPALSGMTMEALEAFLTEHAKLQRTATAMPGAAAFVEGLQHRGILTGIASNAQAYTLAELRAAGLDPDTFPEEFCFWSFRQGFSKPDPGVFQFLTQRLAAHGVKPEEILMIGDRLDNDIAPAQAAGWQTWHFQGTWPVL
jgi:HAD superfamily hydrolase (TIGR01509 family)